MLNEDKIKLMTSISMFEKKEGKKIFPLNRYFKGDYVSNHVVRSFLGYTFCWVLGALIWALYHIEALFSSAVLDNLWEMVVKCGLYYVVGLILYLLITVVVYSGRYNFASRGMKVYVAKLRRLEKRYEFQSKSREMTKEGGRRDRTSGV